MCLPQIWTQILHHKLTVLRRKTTPLDKTSMAHVKLESNQKQQVLRANNLLQESNSSKEQYQHSYLTLKHSMDSICQTMHFLAKLHPLCKPFSIDKNPIYAPLQPANAAVKINLPRSNTCSSQKKCHSNSIFHVLLSLLKKWSSEYLKSSKP